MVESFVPKLEVKNLAISYRGDPALSAVNLSLGPRELGETARGSEHYQALFTLGIFLFLVTFVINLLADLFVRRKRVA